MSASTTNAPDAWIELTHNGSTTARCALWWRGTPAYPDRKVGLIGHYTATSQAAGEKLLDTACAALRVQGCDLAVGPMNGSTWDQYRLVTETGVEPPFLLEPTNPSHWPLHFTAASFKPLAHYVSRIADDLNADHLISYQLYSQRGQLAHSSCGPHTTAHRHTGRPGSDQGGRIEGPFHRVQASKRALSPQPSALGTEIRPLSLPQVVTLGRATFRLRPVNLADPERELRLIHGLVRASFCDNLLYKDLPWEVFAASYKPLLPALRPELVIIAEHEEQPVGFIFGVPDLLQAQYAAVIDTIILKTCGVLPAFRGTGLGTLLNITCLQQARALGYRRAIYALMCEGSTSDRISQSTTRLLRRYTLFGKELI